MAIRKGHQMQPSGCPAWLIEADSIPAQLFPPTKQAPFCHLSPSPLPLHEPISHLILFPISCSGHRARLSHSHASPVFFCRSTCLLSATATSNSTTSSLKISSLPSGNTNCPGPCVLPGCRLGWSQRQHHWVLSSPPRPHRGSPWLWARPLHSLSLVPLGG